MASSSKPPASGLGAQSNLHQHHSEEDDIFTDEMRNRQARGKDPYGTTEGTDEEVEQEEEDDQKEEKLTFGAGLMPESYEERERRQFAMEVLDSHEMLMRHAHSNGDSLAGQRRRFQAMACGFPDPMEGRAARRQTQQSQKQKQKQSRRSASRTGAGSGSGSGSGSGAAGGSDSGGAGGGEVAAGS